MNATMSHAMKCTPVIMSVAVTSVHVMMEVVKVVEAVPTVKVNICLHVHIE